MCYVCVSHTHCQSHGSCPLPSSVMPLAIFCIQVYSYLNRHPAACFPNQIIQNTDVSSCILGLQRANSPGKLWKSSFSKKYFHLHTFLVTEQHCTVILNMAPALCRNCFLGCQLVTLSCWDAGCHTCFTSLQPAPMTHICTKIKTHSDTDKWAGVHTYCRCRYGFHVRTHLYMHTCTHMNRSKHPITASAFRSFVNFVNLPTTINVNSKPLLTDFRYTWLGRLAKPT